MKQDQKEREGLSKLTCRYELGFRAREGGFWDFLLFLSTLRSRRVGNKGVRSETVKITATGRLITVVGPMSLIQYTMFKIPWPNYYYITGRCEKNIGLHAIFHAYKSLELL